ncbi:MAG TPA: hypothetical protein VJQ54_25195, partial [Candidatus Sulfotelmatobacter sp.]|nr:hypothetical protein [Candidatus Sulfotelmatobacter sp.]
VICVDTAIAHLAGSLGVKCWVMLPKQGTDWRWLRDRADSPWYPRTTRLFRQAVAGDWVTVVDRMSVALADRLVGNAALTSSQAGFAIAIPRDETPISET